MKICYVNPTFLIRRPIAELISRLSKDNDIAVFVPKKPFKKVENKWHSDSALRTAKIYSYSAITIPFINFEWPIPITPMFFINLLRIFRKYKIVHMWTYFYINSFFTLLTSLFFPKRKVILTSDTFPAYSFSSGKIIDTLFIIYTKIFGWFLFSIPNKIHLYGHSLIKHAKKIGIKEDKIKIISTGINLKKFQEAKARDRKEFGLNKKDFVVLFIGLLVPRKGVDIIIKTAEKVIKNNKNIKFLLVGGGPNKQKYVDMVKKSNLENNFVFAGWRKDVPEIFKASDILILPSKGEGLPGVVMEAMASGLPVIASNIPCTNNLVENKKTGFLCETDDITAFKEKILELSKNKKKRRLMGSFGKAKIKSFDWDIVLKEYIRIYKSF